MVSGAAGLEHVALLTALTGLTLRECRLVTNDGLRRLEPLAALKALSLSGCTSVSDRGLQSLAQLTGAAPRPPPWGPPPLHSGSRCRLHSSEVPFPVPPIPAPAIDAPCCMTTHQARGAPAGPRFLSEHSGSGLDLTGARTGKTDRVTGRAAGWLCSAGAHQHQLLQLRDGPGVRHAAHVAAAAPEAHRGSAVPRGVRGWPAGRRRRQGAPLPATSPPSAPPAASAEREHSPLQLPWRARWRVAQYAVQQNPSVSETLTGSASGNGVMWGAGTQRVGCIGRCRLQCEVPNRDMTS